MSRRSIHIYDGLTEDELQHEIDKDIRSGLYPVQVSSSLAADNHETFSRVIVIYDRP